MFLQRREGVCRCHQPDQAATDDVVSHWTSDDIKDYYERRCWASFRETAVPVVVCKHLLAAGMTGQFLLSGDEFPDRATIVERYPILGEDRYRARLDECLSEMATARDDVERGMVPGGKWSSTLANEQQLSERAERFARNMRLIAKVAEHRYEQRRLRSEHLFRTFLFGRLDTHGSRAAPTKAVTELLGHMERF